MTSTFLGIEIGKRAVSAHEQALNTTGHNLSHNPPKVTLDSGWNFRLLIRFIFRD